MTTRIYRRSYVDRKGKRKKSKRWTVERRAPDGRTCRESFAERRDALSRAREIELMASADGVRHKDLAEHLADYAKTLEARKRTPAHIQGTVSRIRTALESCGFARTSDVNVYQIELWLSRLRTEEREPKGAPRLQVEKLYARTFGEIAAAFGVSRRTVQNWQRSGAPIEKRKVNDIRAIELWLQEQVKQRSQPPVGDVTGNYYLNAVKAFFRWLVEVGRIAESENCLRACKGVKAEHARTRRVLSQEEVQKLLQTTAAGGEYRGLSGEDRAWLYRLALSTGFRRGELASLTPESFDLSPESPTVSVTAAYSKRRRRDTLPLKRSLLPALRAWLADKPRGEQLWPGSWFRWDSARMLRSDLAAAGIPYSLGGLKYDFHALRGQFVTELVKAGTNPALAQRLARHSDANLTLAVYTRLELSDMAAAIDELPAVG